VLPHEPAKQKQKKKEKKKKLTRSSYKGRMGTSGNEIKL
jgi:hypothetical protein